MTLPPYLAQWPAPWLQAYQEREAIMHEAGVTDSERKAEADIRRVAAGEGEMDLFGEIAKTYGS